VSQTCPVRSCSEKIDTTLCERHRRRAATSLAELPRYYVRLALAMVPGTSSAGDRISGSRTPPLPINVTARALQDDMVRVVRSTENDYRRHRAWSTARRRHLRESVALDAGVGFLCRHFDALIETSFGVDAALDVLRIVSASRTVLGLDRLVHRLPAPCPSCDSMALERESGADRVRCRNCGREFTEDEYARLVLILASGA
jgi:hypothetical protein